MFLTQVLQRVAQQHPDAPLTVFGDRVHTTGESVDRVARLGAAMAARGIGVGDRVALLGVNSDRYFEVLFACWWIGAVPTPLNARWTPKEVTCALDDVDASMVFVDAAFAATVDGVNVPVAPMVDRSVAAEDDGYEQLIAGHDPVPDTETGGAALAVLIFSGGTTGRPKAVMHSHRGLMVSLLSGNGFARSCEIGGVALVMAPLSHIAALLGMLNQALIGGTLVFADRFDAGVILRLIEKHRVVTMTSIPVMLQAMYGHPDFDEIDTDSMRHIVYGAAPMPTATLMQAMTAFENAEFIQGYGMTETAVIANLLGSDHEAGGDRLRSAGRGSLHAEIRIVDGDDVEVPRGVVGELVTRGDHVMLGYWGRPDETADAMRGGWFHTGDLAFMDDAGYLFIVDRAKDMIISGGENVYSVEVENAVVDHPAVSRCAVIGVADERWGERVHAVVELKPGAVATGDDIRAHVRALISPFKSPRTVSIVDQIPSTPTGKIDKRALRRDAGHD